MAPIKDSTVSANIEARSRPPPLRSPTPKIRCEDKFSFCATITNDSWRTKVALIRVSRPSFWLGYW